MNSVIEYFFYPLSPVLSPIVAGLLLIGAECFPKHSLKKLKYGIAGLAMLISLFATFSILSHWPIPFAATPLNAGTANIPTWLLAFAHGFRLDSASLMFFAAIAVFTFLSVVFMDLSFSTSEVKGEILILTMFIATGMMLLVSADNFIMVFLALELLSLPTYVLVGVTHKDRSACEAALKYFLFGSFATVLLVFGIALLYAQFGTLEIPRMAAAIQAHQGDIALSRVLVYSGLALIIIAVGFKIGAAPFHMWVPDAYQGAPTAITGFMGSAVKLAGFGLVMRLMWGLFLPFADHWVTLLNVLAVVTMFVGNLAALVQDNLKRMFAYSSISHAGYLLLAITSIPAAGPNQTILLYYLCVYGLLFLGLFAILALIEQQTKSTDIFQISGMGWSHPVLGACMAVFALSAAGIPPTAGFLAKYVVFLQAVRTGHTDIVIWAVVSSMVGAYYYLRTIVYLYMKDPREKLALPPAKQHAFALVCIVACALSMFYFAVTPVALGLSAR